MIQKDILARLLATENLSVVHANVKTASFNVKDRVLTLPQWDDMKDFTYDHLVGHEVGHALFTPVEGWHESVSDKGAGFKSFLNVIEDARIERMIQARYPGLRRNFVRSYKKMLEDGFFGDNVEAINNYPLIDRVNVYFKAGVTSGVRIDKDEMVWINEIEAARTWEEVVDIAERMYGEAKRKQEEEKALREMMNDEEEAGDEIPDDGDDYYDYDFEEEEDEEENENLDGGSFESDDSGEEGEQEAEETFDSEKGGDNEPVSSTDESLRSNIANEFGNLDGREITNLFINETIDVKEFVVGYKEVLSLTSDMTNILTTYNSNKEVELERMSRRKDALYSEFMTNNKKTINYLVKEFEMKKSAANYSRATVSKTGVIDPVLMNSYKYNDDIFRKATIVPDGKNHGMIMYLDWSGSMTRDLFNTVEQTLNLVYFCRQIGIPFRVYAFTNRFTPTMKTSISYRAALAMAKPNDTFPELGFKLVEFFSNKMNKAEIAQMTKSLLLLARDIYRAEYFLSLGGTPLEDTLALAPKVYEMFQKENKVDIVNTVFLTDGDSHPLNFVGYSKIREENRLEESWSVIPSKTFRNDSRLCNLNDTKTKKKYKLVRGSVTKALIQNYIARTGSNTIGFRIVSSNKNNTLRDFVNMGMDWTAADDLYNELRKEKYITIPGQGYSKFFALKGGKELQTANGDFKVADDAKKGQILSAFKKSTKGKLVSRSLLNEFIKEVA
jgi:hypothetical protein